jgi:hypothetical protein
MHKIKTFETLNPKPNQDMHNPILKLKPCSSLVVTNLK